MTRKMDVVSGEPGFNAERLELDSQASRFG